jgi:O-antigen biosynthesis protein
MKYKKKSDDAEQLSSAQAGRAGKTEPLETPVAEHDNLQQIVFKSHVRKFTSNLKKAFMALFPHGSNRFRLLHLASRALKIWRTSGIKILIQKTKMRLSFFMQQFKPLTISYKKWIQKNEPTKLQLLDQKKISRTFTHRPLISIIMPVYNTPKAILEASIQSVLAQTYDDWELCIANGSPDSTEVVNTLNAYAKKDQRIKVKHLEKNLGIAGNTNVAISLAAGKLIGFLDHDDLLAPFALFEVVKAVIDSPDIDMIYSDEDKITADGQERYDPFFKPAFSPDLLRSVNYMPHFMVIQRKLGDEIGWVREGFDGAQDYDLILRAAERSKKIAHCPYILYHWRAWTNSTALRTNNKDYATQAGIRALQDHLQRMSIAGHVVEGYAPTTYRVVSDPISSPLVSIIIPNSDHAVDLEKCISSIITKSSYKNFEIIIVENGSREEATFSLYRELQKFNNIQLIQNNHKPFNYSLINNYAAEYAKGNILLFLNNDTEVINSDWLERMLEYILRSDVGIVGAKLYYSNDTIQHGGVILGIGGIAGHVHKYVSRQSFGYFGRLMQPQNLSAVTAACLMIKKDVFNEVQGFNQNFQLAFGDIDLCLKVRKKGYLVVWTPYAELYHYESRTRGYEDTLAKQNRFEEERACFLEYWKGFLEEGDPYYNPSLNLNHEDYSIDTQIRSQHPRVFSGLAKHL